MRFFTKLCNLAAVPLLLFMCAAAFSQSKPSGAGSADYFDGEKGGTIEFIPGGRAEFYSRVNNTFYRIEFSPESAELIKRAKERYFSDFEKRRLKKKKGDSSRKYGEAAVTLRWNNRGDFSEGARTARTTMAAGYVFAGGSPYFCVLIDGADDEGQSQGQSRVLRNSGRVVLLFNKKQIDKFAALCYTE